MIWVFEKLICKIKGHIVPKSQLQWLRDTDRSIESSWCYCERCDRLLYFGRNLRTDLYVNEGTGYGYKHV